MKTRVVSALTSVALLSWALSGCAQESDSPAEKSNVDKYVDVLFSKDTPGFYMPRDGKIHKFEEPIYVDVQFPECKDRVNDIVANLKQNYGININMLPDNPAGLSVSMIFIGAYSANDFKLHNTYYKLILNNFFNSNEEDAMADFNNIERDGFITRFHVHDKKQITFIVNIIKKNDQNTRSCDTLISSIMFRYLTNRPWPPYERGMSNSDKIFISALYDKSIEIDEDEDKARSDIVKLMNDKLEEGK